MQEFDAIMRDVAAVEQTLGRAVEDEQSNKRQVAFFKHFLKVASSVRQAANGAECSAAHNELLHLRAVVSSMKSRGCGQCGKLSTKRCAACGSIFYCSRECQRAHYEAHKSACKKSCAIIKAASK